jgi:hypothetical protein
MTDIRIGRFVTRYRLPGSATDERLRLNKIMHGMLDETLEQVLQHAGILPGDGGELCLRRIDIPVRLRLAAADTTLAAHWAEALVAEIIHALRDGHAIVYHSPHQALLDLAFGVADADLRRSWAWRQLGLWQLSGNVADSAAVSELMRLLCAQPAALSGVIQALAQADRLQPLVQRVTAGHWQALAVAVLAASGAGDLLTEVVIPASPRALREALQVVEFSRLLQALNAAAVTDTADTATRRALAILAVLETEPAWLPTDAAPALITLVAGAIHPAAAGSATTQSPGAAETSMPGAASPDDAMLDDDLPDALTEPETPVSDLRRHAMTEFGGLLFLLGVFDDLNLIEQILNHPLLGQRPLRWSLHGLALTLVPAGLDDPAVLALTGLAADAEPPLTAGAPMTTAEAAVLQEFAAGIAEQLRALLQWPDDEEPATILDFVCRRHAEILAEPGWIDVKLALDEVSTDIRRAGLDLNPGYIPWLGIVVRFVYD